MKLRSIAASLLCAGALSAQTIQVHSEFRRVDPFGEIVATDREGRPREILSPLLARNSHSTFLCTVTAPPGMVFYVYFSQYPEVMEMKLYKAMYSEHDGAWIPDRLLEITSPHTSQVPDRYHGIANQTAEVFVIDLWVPRTAEPGRMKVDIQLGVAGNWITYPMEVRISDEIVPNAQSVNRGLAPVGSRSDASLLGPLREYLCRVPEKGRVGPASIRGLIHRNVIEDLALVKKKEAELGAHGAASILLRGLGINRATFCSAERFHSRYGPEWFLRARDMLYRGTIDYY